MQIKIFLLTIIYMIKYGYFMNPIIIFSQFWHETGGFKSDIFKENNNVSGMKKNSRPYDIGVNRKHAVYKSVADSIKCFYERQIQFKVKPTSNIFNYLTSTQKSGYAKDSKYITRVTNVYEIQKKRLQPYFVLAVPSIIGLALGIYYFIKK